MREQIAKRLKSLRFATGMTADDVAHQINCSANHIWQIERARCKTNIESIAKLCKLYGVSIDLLVYGSDKEFQQAINTIYSRTA